MYVQNKEAHYALRALAMLVGVALLLWTLGLSPFDQRADAANVTSFSDTLSDSDLGVASNHTIGFTLPNGALDTNQIVLTFSSFTIPVGFDFNDVDVTVGGNPITLGSSPSGTTWGVATTSTTVTLTTSTTSGPTVASGTAVVVLLGTNATVGATGNTQIVNPGSTNSYEIILNGTILDSGTTQVAIIDNVVVTARVTTFFDFNIYGLATSTEVNGTSTTRTSTETTIPFGTLTNGVITTLAQDLTVETNAANGFVVTIYEDGPLLSSTGADIDEFDNDTDQDSPIAWSSPSNSISNENTWGHWGITSEDDYNSDQFGTNFWIAASTTPRVVFHHASSSDGFTENIGSTTVGFQAEITSLQEAGDDYNTTLTYIATPTF